MKTTEDPTGELLSSMYKALRVGCDNLCSVTPKISDRFMLTSVTSQIEKYSEFSKRTTDLMRARDQYPKEPSLLSRLAQRGSVAVETLADSSRSGIAGMISRGNVRGATRLGQTLEKCRREGCDQEVTSLCRDVIGYQLREADKMKDFM